ncbi:ABC transporter ATP-binding protein [Aerococcaceae bacterium zg-ZJ1578]|uniref:ABC transporter ATP-binding protein n=1 Tax=Aerococcaceae bacterium zg-252 TaxID=2796928 RepID=UPI001A35B254|nr:ABC transporter ATP-binding protein [Aerococcaceae bacterium zg-1578]
MSSNYSMIKIAYRNIYEYFKKAKIYGILEQSSFFLRTLFFYINIQVIEILFDNIQANKSVDVIIYSLLMIGTFKIVSEILTLISKYLMVKNSYSNMGKFMVDFQNKLSRVEPYNFEDTKFLDNINRIKECLEYESLGHFATNCIQIILYYTSIIIFTVYYLYNLYPVLTLIVVFAFVPTIMNHTLNIKMFENFENNTIPIRRQADTYKKYIVNRKYFKETRLLGIFSFFYKRYVVLLDRIYIEQWKVSKKIFVSHMAISIVSVSGLVFSILILLYVTINCFISIGEFATVFFLLSQFFSTIEELVQGKLTDFLETYVQVKNFYQFMDMEEKSNLSKEGDIAEGIIANNIYFGYPNKEKDTINGINIKLESNKVYALVGPNGSGKTTLSKLLLGIYVPKKGEISVFGRDTKKYRDYDLYDNSTAVFQDFQKYKMSLAENVTISIADSYIDEMKIRENLNKTGFTKNIQLNQILSPEFDGIDLSGGEWQRIAITRAIHRKHELIVLDEPTSAIDPIEEDKLYEYFRTFSKNKISLIVTHRLASAKLADEIIVMNEGRIVETGSHEQLLNKKSFYYDMWQKQETLYKKL